MNRRTDAWRNGCFRKVDDHLVCTTPNQHPPKIDVLPKTFLPIILASKWQARHSSTSLKQQWRPLPSLLYISCSMLSSHHAYLSEIFKEKCLILWKVDSIEMQLLYVIRQNLCWWELSLFNFRLFCSPLSCLNSWLITNSASFSYQKKKEKGTLDMTLYKFWTIFSIMMLKFKDLLICIV